MAMLYIGGVAMPDPDVKGGIVESHEKIWSSDTGRTTKGVMKGTLICTKTTVALKWSGLTEDQYVALNNAIYGKDFVRIKYKSVLNHNSYRELTGYFGTPQFSHLNLDDNLYYATNVSVTFIEQ